MGEIIDPAKKLGGRMKKHPKAVVIAIVCVVVLGLAAGTFYLYYEGNQTEEVLQQIYTNATFYEGVYVNGVSLAGMTIEQAKEALKPTEDAKHNEVRLDMKYGTQTFSITKEDVGITSNIDSVLREAIMLGRVGNTMEKWREIDALKQQARAFETDYTLDPEPALGIVDEIAKAIDRAPTDATMTVDPSKIGEWFAFTDEAPGVQVNTLKLKEIIKQRIVAREFGEIEIPTSVVKPLVTKADLAASIALRSKYQTSYSVSNGKNRVFNIEKAAGLLNGKTLLPGEILSMNETLGPRTKATGWKDAGAIQGEGHMGDEPGGGVCQVSTTLYGAALCANLEIVERWPHSIRSAYVGGGLDATISTGGKDFKVKNNTGSTIYIFSWLEKDKELVHIEIYGEPLGDGIDYIELTSTRISTIAPSLPAPVERLDTTKPPGYRELWSERRSGSIWKSYKVIHYTDGTTEKVFVTDSRYPAFNGIYIVGPPKPEPTPKPDPTETPEPTEGSD